MGAVSTLRRFSVLFIIIIAVVVFFLSYNTYLVDHSLEDLKFALDQTAKAQNIVELERLGLLLDDVLMQEVSSLNADSSNVTTLEFAKNVVSKGGVKQQLRDIEFLLNRVVRNREKNRGGIVLAFDRMNNDIQKFIRFITTELPAGAFRADIFKPAVEIDLSLLDKAKGCEQDWKLRDAISAYEEFINRYPSYPQMRLVKLRLADTYFKSLNYKEAQNIYGALIKEAPQSEEAKVANVVLEKIKEKIKKRAKEKKLSGMISKLAAEPELTADYSELGLVDAYLDRLTKESKELVVYVMKGAETLPKQVVSGIDMSILDRAKEFEEKWQLKEAQALYEKFVTSYQGYEDMAYVKLLLAGIYLKSMQYEKAGVVYENIQNSYPQTKEADLAKRLGSMTKEIITVYQKRQTLIDKIAKAKAAPELAQLYYNLGMVDVYIYDLENAEKAFKKVMELAPGTELAKRAEFMLGWNYKFKADYDEGIAAFSVFIEKYPEDKLAVDSTYHMADSYYKSGSYEEAARSYEECADKFVDSPISEVALFQAGYTYLYNLHDPVKAAEIFKKLKARYPETDVCRFVEGNVTPIVDRSYRDYGFILLKEGKYQEAKEAFEKAIIIDVTDAWAYSGLGTACVLMVLYEEGFDSTNKGLKLMKDEYTHAALAFSYDKKGEYLKAVEEYRLSIAKNPFYVVSHYNLSRDYVILSWYDLAIQEARETIRLLPGLAEAHNNLGVAYWYKGQVIEAESEFKAAISDKPKLLDAQYNLGLLYEAAGKHQNAAGCFQNALAIEPEFESARRHLGRAQSKISK